MNRTLPRVRMSALAYLYDNMRDLPNWFRQLTPRQLEEIAEVMTQWQLPNELHAVMPMEEIERREILRAVALCGGDAIKAAEALKIGKTTIYRKLRAWGYGARNRSLMAQASALAGEAKQQREHFW
jgi:transcriptional regulator of acetoin/glycerol metabolism